MENVVIPRTKYSYDDPCPFEHLGEQLSLKSLKPSDKEWLGAQLFYGKITSPALAKQYGISENTLRGYKNRIMKGGNFQEHGRPALLDEIGQTNIKSQCTGKKYQVTRAEFPKIFEKESQDTAIRRGEISTLHIQPSSRSIGRYLHILKLIKKSAEQATAARIEACSCWRNLFTFILMS